MVYRVQTKMNSYTEFFFLTSVFGRRAVCESAYLNFNLDKPYSDFTATNGHNCIVIRKLLNVKWNYLSVHHSTCWWIFFRGVPTLKIVRYLDMSFRQEITFDYCSMEQLYELWFVVLHIEVCLHWDAPFGGHSNVIQTQCLRELVSIILFSWLLQEWV